MKSDTEASVPESSLVLTMQSTYAAMLETNKLLNDTLGEVTGEDRPTIGGLRSLADTIEQVAAEVERQARTIQERLGYYI